MKPTLPCLCLLCLLISQPYTFSGRDASALRAQTKEKMKPKAVVKAKGKATSKPKYLCPMHPEVTSDKPGICRICKMDLEKQETPQPLSGWGPPGEIAVLHKEVNGYKFEVLLTPVPLPPDPEEAKKIKDLPTYRVDVTVGSIKPQKNIKDADVWFHIVYPNGRNLMPHLKQLEDRYTAEIPIPSTGPYGFMVHANMKSGNVVANFQKVMH